MANKAYEENDIKAIASAIKAKNTSVSKMKVSQMANAINGIPTGGITPSGSQNITENGTYDVTSLAEVIVNVASGGGGEPSTDTCVVGHFTPTDLTSAFVIDNPFDTAPRLVFVVANQLHDDLTQKKTIGFATGFGNDRMIVTQNNSIGYAAYTSVATEDAVTLTPKGGFPWLETEYKYIFVK